MPAGHGSAVALLRSREPANVRLGGCEPPVPTGKKAGSRRILASRSRRVPAFFNRASTGRPCSRVENVVISRNGANASFCSGCERLYFHVPAGYQRVDEAGRESCPTLSGAWSRKVGAVPA